MPITGGEGRGVEAVVLPHVIFREGATYLLEVSLDPYRGPSKLEGGAWLLEFFGSGEIEVGADSMEQDLEDLVRHSWEPKDRDPTQPPRADTAKESRARWIRRRDGVASPEPEARQETSSPVVEEKTDELAGPLERCHADKHANILTKAFVYSHTEEEPVLLANDPYTIVAQASDDPPDEVPNITYGCRGQAEARHTHIQTVAKEWEKLQEDMANGCQANQEALVELQQWCANQPWGTLKCQQQRDDLRSMLATRSERRTALKDVFFDVAASTQSLEEKLREANEVQVALLDKDLVDGAAKKLQLVSVSESLKGRLRS